MVPVRRSGPPDGPTMTALAVRVDTTSPIPPYEQIRAQLAALIVTGRLTEDERLPTVRQLAADLGLAPGPLPPALGGHAASVARPCGELEPAKLPRPRRGAGTRVGTPPSEPPRPAPDQ